MRQFMSKVLFNGVLIRMVAELLVQEETLRNLSSTMRIQLQLSRRRLGG